MSNMNDVTQILSAFVPTRASRRANAGARCTMCGLGIVAVDFALVEVETQTFAGPAPTTRPIHKQCTALLFEEVQRLQEVADGMDDDEWAADPGVEDASEAEVG